MSGQPLVDVESEIGPLLTTLKRFDEASAKELKKGINQLGTQGKPLVDCKLARWLPDDPQQPARHGSLRWPALAPAT